MYYANHPKWEPEVSIIICYGDCYAFDLSPMLELRYVHKRCAQRVVDFIEKLRKKRGKEDKLKFTTVQLKTCPRVREGTLKAPTKKCWCRNERGLCIGPPVCRSLTNYKCIIP